MIKGFPIKESAAMRPMRPGKHAGAFESTMDKRLKMILRWNALIVVADPGW
jgi:hypothetical protein